MKCKLSTSRMRMLKMAMDEIKIGCKKQMNLVQDDFYMILPMFCQITSSLGTAACTSHLWKWMSLKFELGFWARRGEPSIFSSSSKT